MEKPEHLMVKPEGLEVGPSGVPLPTTRLSRVFDGIVVWIGETSSWVWTVLMLLIVYQVGQRYLFGQGSIKMEEAQWHLYAIGFLLALPLAEVRERHVRIDVFAERWPYRRRLWIELFGLLFFLIPLALFVAGWAWPYFLRSWQLSEISSAPDGLPYRWALKSFIVTAFALLAMGGIARFSRVVAALRTSNGQP